jgi:hypothetical protein
MGARCLSSFLLKLKEEKWALAIAGRISNELLGAFGLGLLAHPSLLLGPPYNGMIFFILI